MEVDSGIDRGKRNRKRGGRRVRITLRDKPEASSRIRCRRAVQH